MPGTVCYRIGRRTGINVRRRVVVVVICDESSRLYIYEVGEKEYTQEYKSVDYDRPISAACVSMVEVM